MDDKLLMQALKLFEKAYQFQMEGQFEEAARCYNRSIALHPTAEAHTFLGWTYSFQNRYKEAIAECEKAITVDPEFGNPHNDIGVYLMELNRHREAISHLKRAKKARRYEPRHFPYLNLGRAYEHMGCFHDAIHEYEGALKFDFTNMMARHSIARLRAMMN